MHDPLKWWNCFHCADRARWVLTPTIREMPPAHSCGRHLTMAAERIDAKLIPGEYIAVRRIAVMTRHIGQSMLAVIEYVASHPGCTKGAAAEVATDGQPLRHGYNAVDRTIRAGLVSAVREGNRYRLYVSALAPW